MSDWGGSGHVHDDESQKFDAERAQAEAEMREGVAAYIHERDMGNESDGSLNSDDDEYPHGVCNDENTMMDDPTNSKVGLLR